MNNATDTTVYDGREAFTEVSNYILDVFNWFINTMDSIYILGNFTMLDFSIALLIMGAILPLVIKTTGNYSAYGDSAAINRSNAAKLKEAAASRKSKNK